MIGSSQRLPLRVIVVALLAAVALGIIWLGYESGGDPFFSGGARQAVPAAHPAEKDPLANLKTGFGCSLLEKDKNGLDDLLPDGITEVSGHGGRGLQRQVRSHGLWFPVFDLSDAGNPESPDLAQVRLNQVPLMIVAAHPNPGRANELLTHRFTAVGGLPPYTWSFQPDGELPGFVLDASTGDFSGLSEVPLNRSMNVYVTDSEGSQASVVTHVVIASDEPLMILTQQLPEAVPGQAYEAQLQAAGGASPYLWSLLSGPEGWACDEKTGIITGSLVTPGEITLQVSVSDSITQIQRSFILGSQSGLSIVTPSPLPPAAPGGIYNGKFEAEGGLEPYAWTLAGGQLPSGWNLTQEGELGGMAPNEEGRVEFKVRVVDAAGQTFEKDYQLTVSQGLLVIPSREKAGLAWQYESMSAALGGPVAGVILMRNGLEIYRGQGTNVVDRGLTTGASYTYELTALMADGRWLPYASAVTRILPMSRGRGQPGVSGDPYADRVVAFSPLSAGAYGVDYAPANVTGPPDGVSTFAPAHQPNQVLSLHATAGAGGSIVLEFTDNIVESGSGLDFTVFENVLFKDNDPNQRFMEPATVEVALFEGQWHRFPVRVSVSADGQMDFFKPTYYAQGFAGVNATTGEDPTDPSRSGGDSFDLAILGRPDLQWFRFIRLTSTGDSAIRDASGKLVRHTAENFSLSGNGSSGFDLDAVSAVNY